MGQAVAAVKLNSVAGGSVSKPMQFYSTQRSQGTWLHFHSDQHTDKLCMSVGGYVFTSLGIVSPPCTLIEPVSKFNYFVCVCVCVSCPIDIIRGLCVCLYSLSSVLFFFCAAPFSHFLCDEALQWMNNIHLQWVSLQLCGSGPTVT